MNVVFNYSTFRTHLALSVCMPGACWMLHEGDRLFVTHWDTFIRRVHIGTERLFSWIIGPSKKRIWQIFKWLNSTCNGETSSKLRITAVLHYPFSKDDAENVHFYFTEWEPEADMHWSTRMTLDDTTNDLRNCFYQAESSENIRYESDVNGPYSTGCERIRRSLLSGCIHWLLYHYPPHPWKNHASIFSHKQP